MALTLKRASYAYSAGTRLENPAVTEVDLSVEPGDLAVVLGPSGSGKTTLLRLASGLLEPTSGEVVADGRPVRSGGVDGGAFVVGIAFQRPESQLFAATVADDVAFGPTNLGSTPDAIEADARRALLDVGLDPDEYGARSPFTLSGGEARRAAIAGVLAMTPRYLLLDEPTAGLDAPGRAAVIAAVEHARVHAGVVVVTHDPEEFLPNADAVVVLVEGRSVYSGDVPGLMARAGRLQADGLWTPPEVARVQLMARDRGLLDAPPLLDPVAAAAALAGAGER
ncbi:MAG TPA: ATP-binding cassette domain-containing protein [Coriobacteriia bacterium]